MLTRARSLNVLEKAWMSWYLYWGNPIIATGIMSFVMHEVSLGLRSLDAQWLMQRAQVVYFGRCLPWMIIDQMPSMNKYKLQEVSRVTALFRGGDGC